MTPAGRPALRGHGSVSVRRAYEASNLYPSVPLCLCVRWPRPNSQCIGENVVILWCARIRAMNAVVRTATIDDAACVAAVLNEVIGEGRYTLFDQPFSVDDERQFISTLTERSTLLVAEVAGSVVGGQSLGPFLSYARSTSHVATLGTWLRADARGRGIGRLLAAESFAFAHAHDYTKIVIHVLATNIGALRFYRGLGFEEIGVARNHVRLGGHFHDEIYMERHLEPSLR